MKQWMGQQQDQGRNQKIPWIKWKWGPNNPKSMGHWESNPKREIHSIQAYLKKKKEKKRKRKSLNKQSNITLKGTWKRTINKA